MALALAENRALLGASRVEASTDALTGLGNRRKFEQDLSDKLAQIAEDRPFALVILDLNGFKSYNDSFGHAAGDDLLARLGASLARAIAGRGEAYRLGGDEFCVLAACPEAEADQLSARCAGALAMRGDGFSITAAQGGVMLPSEAADASSALALADARMYGNKATAERGPTLAEHGTTVCDLAVANG
jgi:diguanylate cyclase (GGDEF)-like protein